MPLTVAEVAIRAGVTRPTAHRLVQTMISDGYLTQNPRDGRISPGYSVLQLAGGLLDTNQMRIEALPHLEALAHELGERADLGILHRNQLLYLAGVEKPSLPTIYSRFGKTAPAYCASLGKAILAYLPADELKSYFKQVPLTRRDEEHDHRRGGASQGTRRSPQEGLCARPRGTYSRPLLHRLDHSSSTARRSGRSASPAARWRRSRSMSAASSIRPKSSRMC